MEINNLPILKKNQTNLKENDSTNKITERKYIKKRIIINQKIFWLLFFLR
jgi:hypothetical protein